MKLLKGNVDFFGWVLQIFGKDRPCLRSGGIVADREALSLSLLSRPSFAGATATHGRRLRSDRLYTDPLPFSRLIDFLAIKTPPRFSFSLNFLS